VSNRVLAVLKYPKTLFVEKSELVKHMPGTKDIPAAGLFEEFFDRLVALVTERLSVQFRYQDQLPSDSAKLVLEDGIREFGKLLRAIFRYNLPEALNEEAGWYASLLESRGLGREAFVLILDSWLMAIHGLIKPPECHALCGPLEKLRDNLDRLFSQLTERRQVHPSPEVRTMADLLTQAAFRDLLSQVRQKIAAGTAPETLIPRLLLPAVQEIGRRWEAGEINIFQEHLGTETLLRLLPILLTAGEVPPRLPYAALVSCVPGEEHQMLVAALATFLELRGWRTYPVGRSLPRQELIKAATFLKPDVFFLSLMMVARLPEALEVVEALHGAQPRLPVIVGGRGARLALPLFQKRGIPVLQDFQEAHQTALEMVSHA
jgi:methanogenic corrinoid protein MtbC1